MPFELKANDILDLLEYIAEKLEDNACDESLRFTLEWASKREVNQEDLVDLLQENGSFCDCEVVLNISPDDDLSLIEEEAVLDSRDPWKLPPDFEVDNPAKEFTKVIVSDPEGLSNCHTTSGEILVPPPYGTKPKKRMRKLMHFFVGLESGLPSELGFVRLTEPTTSAAFAKRVRNTSHPEFASFGPKEAHFYLSKIENMKEFTPMATHFIDVKMIASKPCTQLRMHKVLLRKRK
ncbi:MAG: DUF2695 domain-containing protein [Planctomycetia bacterium]|jgi:hypothetical protein